MFFCGNDIGNEIKKTETRNDKNGIENGVKTIEVALATCNIVLSAMICSLSLSISTNT